jgi:hypothetical protein
VIHYGINGSKTFITNGWHASLICVAVITSPFTGLGNPEIGYFQSWAAYLSIDASTLLERNAFTRTDA